MKLDFSALAQPAKARGQLGTTGTRASARGCAYPLAQPGEGTTGDKPAAVALVAYPAVAVPAACPLMSPDCPQVTDAEKLNAGAVSPASAIVPVTTAQGSREQYAHARETWRTPDAHKFAARVQRFTDRGLTSEAADALAERMAIRDADLDDRRLCLECTYLGAQGRCIAAATGRIPGASRKLEPVQTILHRCEAFGLRKEMV